jgi:glucosyl-3-phosphoglycerate synthase
MKSAAIIPAHNESATVERVVASAREIVDEVIVVASCCSDSTAFLAEAAGAKVIAVETPGKHHALRAGMASVSAEELVFLDADLQNPSPKLTHALLSALRENPVVSIAKGFYGSSETGRLTQLCAKPIISLLLPEIGCIRQPLSGEFAVRQKDVQDMPFAPGAAVDLGILIHCAQKGQVVEVDLGVKVHKHRSIDALAANAVEVLWTIVHNTVRIDPSRLSIDETVLSSFVSMYDLGELPPVDPSIGSILEAHPW